MKAITTILFALLFSTSAHGEPRGESTMDGVFLQEQCKVALLVFNATEPLTDNTIDYSFSFGFCFGAVRAVLGINTVYEKVQEGKALFCMLSSTIKYNELVAYIVKWTEENPTLLTFPFDQVIVLALKAKYPCHSNIFDPPSQSHCQREYSVSNSTTHRGKTYERRNRSTRYKSTNSH